jgi:hypothetical protein
MNKSPVAVTSKSTATKTPAKQSQSLKSTVVHNSPGAISTHSRPAPVEEYFLQNASLEKKRRLNQLVRAELWQLCV